MLKRIESIFREVIPTGAAFCSLRFVRTQSRGFAVREGVPMPPATVEDCGAMVTVIRPSGGIGYAATSDLTRSGLSAAAQRAGWWADQTAGRSVTDFSTLIPPAPAGEYLGPEEIPAATASPAETFSTLTDYCNRLKTDDRIVEWMVGVQYATRESLYLTSTGGRTYQRFATVVPTMSVSANDGDDTQTRTLGGHGAIQQGGLEVLARLGFEAAAPRLAAEALELLAAENCPSGTMDVVLDPDQMYLQIHESIGHPLEIDRILGDERNYAGTSFVTLDMIGSYRYGSDLLNVVFDPDCAYENASFGWDDDGAAAERAYIIETGILKRALGGGFSQGRSGKPGVACSRACSWNRPPIDRMANLNLEPGDSCVEEMIASIQRGIYMKTNRSWSIDDSRNKFQFGCEWARLIEDGKLTKLVKDPNYRGISATFWRNLKAVAGPDTVQVLGSPFCGKGEPNQCIGVGHSTPAAMFAEVDVFGGE